MQRVNIFIIDASIVSTEIDGKTVNYIPRPINDDVAKDEWRSQKDR